MSNLNINELFYLYTMDERKCSSEMEILKIWKEEAERQIRKMMALCPEHASSIKQIEIEIHEAKCLGDIGQYYCKYARYNDEQEYASARIANLSLMDLYIRMCDSFKLNGSMYHVFQDMVRDFFCIRV